MAAPVYKLRALDTTILWQPSKDPVLSGAFEHRQTTIIQQIMADATRRYYTVTGPELHPRLFRHAFVGITRDDVDDYETMRVDVIGSAIQVFDCIFNDWIDVELTGEGLAPRWEPASNRKWNGTIELLERIPSGS